MQPQTDASSLIALASQSANDFQAFMAERASGLRAALPQTSKPLSAEEMWRGGLATATEIADALAAFYAVPRGRFEAIASRPHLMSDLSRRYLRESHLFPYDEGGVPMLALADPARGDAVRAVQLALGAQPALRVVSFEDIALLFERASEEASPDTGPDTGVAAIEIPEETGDSLQAIQDLARGAPVVRLIDEILERAVGAGATDIHVETERDHLRVRFRVDGFLRRDQRLPLGLAPAVISRIKILAGLDIADRRLPQDGRANIRIGNAEADLRVAVMPTLHGETAVLRILLRDSRLLDLGRIGMSTSDQRRFETLLAEPHGVVVVTGPTGSGKTTTLATAISMLNDPGRKIVTVEDPVEYQIPGIHQTQIKPSIGLTFASALRSFLRHDPDVIMIGEMRDRETAGIGIQAALTGHLVLTTLHTNSASDAVVRLIDMGVEPYLLGASLRGVLGQRLVRRLCERCKAPDDSAREGAVTLAARRGIRLPATLNFHRAVGCEACGQSGYRGRIGIFEVLPVDDDIRAAIRRDPDPAVIGRQAEERGMTSMLEDGLAKCAEGMTTIDEVIRATG
ncbi:type II/IV secretion system protein [Rhizobiaceae bacterium CRRU44]|uniref:Type II/IV secretion system protein n=1 Tax=Ferranicluibacter rubi TaxID=2715133 RepID=A0AA43ZBR6_9HYPH|nr:GspE/PulE family protein [Ferranicluibacter rubi]NHT74875.1 type II/IV secretion system protein [Ferranicluibacter rubi]